jgi:hypothetical protein
MSTHRLNKNVLLRISEGVNSFYSLTKTAKVGSNEGVLSALERLQKNGLIEKGKVGSRRIQPYHLTEDGFDIALRFVDEILDFDSFVNNNKDYFSLVFGYWKCLGEFGLHEWVKKVLKDSVPRIDVQIWGELITGDRSRYSHGEFITDLYLRIYGPWLQSVPWENLKQNIPVEHIRDFLRAFPEISQTRLEEFDNACKDLDIIRNNILLYRENVIC